MQFSSSYICKKEAYIKSCVTKEEKTMTADLKNHFICVRRYQHRFMVPMFVLFVVNEHLRKESAFSR